MSVPYCCLCWLTGPAAMQRPELLRAPAMAVPLMELSSPQAQRCPGILLLCSPQSTADAAHCLDVKPASASSCPSTLHQRLGDLDGQTSANVPLNRTLTRGREGLCLVCRIGPLLLCWCGVSRCVLPCLDCRHPSLPAGLSKVHREVLMPRGKGWKLLCY